MPVRYAVIGAGAISQRRHIPECVANPDSVLIAIADSNRERCETISRKYGAKAYFDWREVANHPEVDAVVVAGPNHLHAPMTVGSLSAGKHVLCEKPMSTNRDEARAMIEAARASGKYLMIAHNQRFLPAHMKAREILASGRVGKVLSFRTAFKHPGPEGWSVDAAKSWFFSKEQAMMGVTGDLGIHKADLMRWLLGEEFVEVSAMIGTLDKKDDQGNFISLDDNAFINLKSSSGVMGTMSLSWTNYGVDENYTVIYCTRGVLALGTDPGHGVIVSYRNGDQELHKFAQPAARAASGIIDALTRSILEKSPPEISGEEGFKSLNVILTAMDSAKEGRTLRIDGASVREQQAAGG